MSKKKRELTITPKQRTFLVELIETNDLSRAYKAAYATRKRDGTLLPKSETYRRGWIIRDSLLKRKDFNELLTPLGLGLDTFAHKMKKLLAAKKGVYFHGEKIAEEDDSAVQVQALKSLQTLLGLNVPATQSVNIYQQTVGKQQNNMIVYVQSDDEVRRNLDNEPAIEERIRFEERAQRVAEVNGKYFLDYYKKWLTHRRHGLSDEEIGRLDPDIREILGG